MHVYIKDGMAQAAQELLTTDPTTPSRFKLERDNESGEAYISIYGDPFSPTFALRVLPDDMVDRYSVESYIVDNTAAFRTEGYYVEGDAEIRCHFITFKEGSYLKKRMFIDISAPTIQSLQRAYFLFREGKVKLIENWEAPQMPQWNTVDPAKVIREVCPASKRVVLRTECYTHKLEYFQMLYAQAKRDFPDLKPEDVEVVHFGGEHYAKTDGIEFDVDLNAVPKTYSEISELEFTR